MKQLQLSNIELGRLIEVADDALAEVGKDCSQRPNQQGPRKVKIEIVLNPDIQNYGDRTINQPSIDWKVETSMPGCKGMTTRAFVEGDRLMINEGMPTGGNPSQTTIYDGGSNK